MKNPDIDKIEFSEIIKQVRNFENDNIDRDPLKIVFLRNITLETVIPFLKYSCYINNLKLNVEMGDYNNIIGEVMEKNSSLFNYLPDIIVICLKLDVLSENLTKNFTGMKINEIKEEVNRILNFIEKIISEIRKNSEAIILLHNFEAPVYPCFGIIDYQDRFKQCNTIREVNNKLLDIVKDNSGVYIVDVDNLQSRIGYNNYFDKRYWYIGKAPYTKDASKIIAKEYMKFILALKGKNKKCLVLDCDNTLWGGIVGEEGINKIKIGKIYPGLAYSEFQQAILELYNRGVMLAICSKNNKEDVLEVLENHPDMVLKKDNFTSIKTNWKDKAENISEIAKELNIGLDSFVFIDDNEFEINLVKKLLPQVETILLPKDISLYKDLLKSTSFFDTLTLSEEDKKRSIMYKEEVKRKKARDQFKSMSIEDYYKYLEMEITINPSDDFSIPRISQLTQKTNQFNLTTKRYSESEINKLSNSKNNDIYYLHYKDRFGDSGIVGIAIISYIENEAIIESFLLSCRILGRRVEDIFLDSCINAIINKGYKLITALYIKTKKNEQVKTFYENHSFSIINHSDKEITYSYNKDKLKVPLPNFFKSVIINIEKEKKDKV